LRTSSPITGCWILVTLARRDESCTGWLTSIRPSRQRSRLLDLFPGIVCLAVQGFGVHACRVRPIRAITLCRQVSRKRFSHGLQFLASYTWSHSLDDYSGDPTGTSDVTVVPGNQAPGFMLNNYASSDFDPRHRFVFSGIYDLPKFYKGTSGFARQAVMDGNYPASSELQSGTPFSV
jgi:hypothetical protein